MGDIATKRGVAIAESDTVVIDLRTANEGVEVESAQASQRRFRYINLPVGQELSRSLVADFEQQLKQHRNRPIIVHSSSGNRAGMLWAAHLLQSGVTLEKAQARVSVVLTTDVARTAIVDYARTIK